MNFEEFAKQAVDENPGIIEKWKTGSDPYERALAKTVLKAAGVTPCD